MSRWQMEMEKVRLAHRGRLHPKHVVEAARPVSSPLHDKFEWNDGHAAHLYRLTQASELIRVVTIVPKGATEPVRAYVSLSSDRLSRSGYRAMVDVLSDRALLAQLVADARSELECFSVRFERVKRVAEFGGLFRQIKRIVHKKRPKR